MNLWIGVGRLGKDPDLRYTPGGKAVCGFRIAVDNGKDQEPTWVNIAVWDKQAENCANHLTKGREVLIEGRLQIREYQAQDGTKKSATEIVARNVKFLGGKKAEGGEGGGGFTPSNPPDDDVPF